ncbi:MAG TPA: YibE/F family protein [Selenomonadales bacterium]|nr:YibE/F family protein [Selenomonadales bacterium]
MAHMVKLGSTLRILFMIGFLLAAGCSSVFADPGKPVPEIPPIDYVQGVVVSVQALDNPAKKPSPGTGGTDLVILRLTSGPEKGQEVRSLHHKMNMPGMDIHPEPGDKVIVAVSQDLARKSYHIADYERLPYVYALLGIFAAVLLAVGRRVGLRSLFVICFAVFVILEVMIPLILKGFWSITAITFAISAVIAVVTQVTVSGWNPKTWGAVLGTVGGVAIAGLLASLSITLMHLTGLDSEEAIMLKVTYLASVNFQDVLFAGIILGSLGAVMDVAISIASAQYEIKGSCPELRFWGLFKSGLNVGKDIMGTMSNTLILAYLGSFLPLILLLTTQQNLPLIKILNLNLIVTEVVRAITGSIGLICAIPVTAAITAFFLSRRANRQRHGQLPHSSN